VSGSWRPHVNWDGTNYRCAVARTCAFEVAGYGVQDEVADGAAGDLFFSVTKLEEVTDVERAWLSARGISVVSDHTSTNVGPQSREQMVAFSQSNQ
jgi:hypothetical protein